MTIKVLLVDDYDPMRASVRDLLAAEPDIDIVGEASNGQEALQLAGQHTPDVVITDVAMPVLDGFQTARLFRTRFPTVRIIAFSTYVESCIVMAMQAAGACAYVKKGAGGARELPAIVRAVVEQCDDTSYGPHGDVSKRPSGVATDHYSDDSEPSVT